MSKKVKEINAPAYEPFNKQPDPGITIIKIGAVDHPTFRKELDATKRFDELGQVHDRYAQQIAEALYNSLPQGIFDRMVMHLWGKRMSGYIGKVGGSES